MFQLLKFRVLPTLSWENPSSKNTNFRRLRENEMRDFLHFSLDKHHKPCYLFEMFQGLSGVLASCMRSRFRCLAKFQV